MTHHSIKARNLCVCLFLSYLRLTWEFQHGCCLVQGCATTDLFHSNDTVNKSFTNFWALSTGATTVTCALEPITAELTSTTYLKKQADLYLQRCELDQDFAGGSVPFCSVHLNWLLWINETKRVRAESVPVWGDPETRRRQSGIGICGRSCVASC